MDYAAAIFFVWMCHLNMRLLIAGVPYSKWLREQLVSARPWNGQRGVQTFFALSGFLIASTAIAVGLFFASQRSGFLPAAICAHRSSDSEHPRSGPLEVLHDFPEDGRPGPGIAGGDHFSRSMCSKRGADTCRPIGISSGHSRWRRCSICFSRWCAGVWGAAGS
jgi:hypothetical protein